MKSTRRGSDSPVHRREKTPRFQIPLDKWPVSPGTPREASGVPCLNPRRGLTLLSQVCIRAAATEIARRDPAGHPSYTALLDSLRDAAILAIRPTLLMLFAASGLLLLITC